MGAEVDVMRCCYGGEKKECRCEYGAHCGRCSWDEVGEGRQRANTEGSEAVPNLEESSRQ